MDFYNEIIDFSKQIPVINTHCHHHRDEEFVGFNLKKLINESYVAWVNPISDEDEVPSELWFRAVRCNNAFYWLEQGIQHLYQTNLALDRENFRTLSDLIENAHRDTDFHIRSMKNHGYWRVLQECYWDPGSDNGHPELMSPLFRVNMFFYGYSHSSTCHNGFNPIHRYSMGNVADIEEYCGKVFDVLKSARDDDGVVALKSAIPYDRGLNLFDCDKATANQAFLHCMQGHDDPDSVEAFQGYMLARLCEMASQLDIPFQMHTGLGKLIHSNAMWLRPTIENHPETKFMLLHGSYPWTDDMLALCHHYRNVYPDISWMPVLSTSTAERFLDELLESARSDGICWGCDTWTCEESLGALMAARHVVATVLNRKIVAGRIGRDDALQLTKMIFHDNANHLYFHDAF